MIRISWPEYSEVRRPAADDVHVFAVDLEESICDDVLFARLSVEEQRRARQFQFDRPRRQFVAVRAALRTLLGRMLDISAPEVKLVVDERGKPRLGDVDSARELHFNIAHSRGLALIAVAVDCEVGVDVEAIRQVSDLEQIARRYFHRAEFEQIAAAPREERAIAFLRCWTGKEAVVKAIGVGLTESLSSFRVSVADPAGAWIEISTAYRDESTRVWLKPLTVHRAYVAAVACVGCRRNVRSYRLCW